MLDKTFDPAAVERRVAEAWDKAGAAKAGVHVSGGRNQPYCIVIPPPNVTGSLHMGHALNNTIQDVLVRFERMRGRDVLWQPGTDHAGIATQMVVERQLAAAKAPSRRELGRQEFLKRVWAWKEESGGTIGRQLRRLGSSCDFSRERFTMDEGLSKAVVTVFVELHRAGLIYKDKRLVNWDTKFETAISDLEVESREVNGQMWHFKYPLAGGETYEYVERDADGEVVLRETRNWISIATTRPETMLGDGAVAVHPSDARYASIVGKLCEIPVGPKEHRRLIPIIVDDYPDPAFGSGAVKITGAHDANDYGVARRNSIPMYRLMDTRGRMRTDGAPYGVAVEQARALVAQGGVPDPARVDGINLVPDAYRGLDRFEARNRVVADIDAEGLMVKVEKKKIMQPFGDRSGTVIEPMLTDQWYVDAKTMAKPALEAVRKGRTKFVPERFANDYYRWLEDIQPWCISRQLWWGHQIPAWYGPDGHIFVALNEAEAYRLADAHYAVHGGMPASGAPSPSPTLPPQGGKGDAKSKGLDAAKRPSPQTGTSGGRGWVLTRDPDVLDTWFSSALWPFSTLGWPDDTPELKAYYPTATLVTGFDIIFFWVARMMMMGLHFMKEVPFETVVIHGLVRDASGAKMSKSKGNVLDPLELIDEYGADALRFALAAQAALGGDIKFSQKRVEGFRNFATKLWNAARFAEVNGCGRAPGFDPRTLEEPVNRWIAGETERVTKAVTEGLETFRLNEAANALYEFIWGVVCDWYVELAKPVLAGPDGPAKDETRACVAWVLDESLKLLHPFMPFLTEELWAHAGAGAAGNGSLLAVTRWPQNAGLTDPEIDAEVGGIVRLISDVRSVRTEMNVPAGQKIELVVVGAGRPIRDRIERHADKLSRLARIETISFAKAPPKGSALIVSGDVTAALPLAGIIDIAVEIKRLRKLIADDEADVAKMDAKLANPSFVERAKPEAVEEARERKAELAARIARHAAQLKRLE